MSRKSKLSKSRPRSSTGQSRREKHSKGRLKDNLLRRLKKVFYSVFVLSCLVGGYLFFHFKAMDTLLVKISTYFEQKSVQYGVRLETIIVEGRENTSARDVAKVLSARKGTSLFDYDVHLLREKLVDLPWVRSAIVQRRFPSTLYVRLTERRPIALWHHQGKTHLIDDQGKEIKAPELSKYRRLLKISGEDAPQYAPQIVTTLQPYSYLKKRLTGAVLNGGRQWDLLFGKGLRIKLPELEIHKALEYVADLMKKGYLDNPGIESIDVRLSDRTFFYLNQEEAKKHQVSFLQKKG